VKKKLFLDFSSKAILDLFLENLITSQELQLTNVKVF